MQKAERKVGLRKQNRRRARGSADCSADLLVSKQGSGGQATDDAIVAEGEPWRVSR